jgi:cell division protein FtsI/penicillin-binding protein 2
VWFLGLDAAQTPRYGVVVLLENPASAKKAAEIGAHLLDRAVEQ